MKQTNFTSVLVFFLVIAFSWSLSAQNANSKKSSQQWKEFSFPEDGFAISLPEYPNRHEDQQLPPTMFKSYPVGLSYAYTVYLPENLGVTLHVVTFPNGCSGFFGDYRDMARRAKAGTLDTAKAGITEKFDPFAFKERMFAGLPALENEHVTPKNSQYYELTTCANRRLFMFTASWPIGSEKPQALARVMSSFRRLND